MKRKIAVLFSVLFIVAAFVGSAHADGSWLIRFLPNATMDNGGIKNNTIDEAIGGLEPGSTETFTVLIRNEHAQTTRWYMKNKVIESLERSAAAGFEIGGGAYSYKLTYTPPGKAVGGSDDRILYHSERVGCTDTSGWSREGLEGATTDLEGYFFLDTLNTNETGTVTLTVSLEGETQNNDYQNTAAEIAMQFAVELANTSPPGSTTRTAVKTGDEHNLIPYYVAMVVTGLLFLYFALDAYTDRLYKKGKD